MVVISALVWRPLSQVRVEALARPS